MFELADRVALVTGASGGIGGAIAQALAAKGARVALTGTRRDALESVASAIGAPATVFPQDLMASGAAETLVKAVEGAMGRIDILVNNAGVTRDGLVMRMSDDDWNRVIEVNLSAGFRLIKACLRGMMKRRSGRIIGISSVVGATGNPGQANYAASKAGMVGMSKAIAAEVASRGITVNCIAPGFIETDMTAALPEERQRAVLATVPAGRFGSANDVGAAAVFLASDEAAYITGQTLHVNGGMAMI